MLPEGSFFRGQLLKITPQLMSELAGLEKIEIPNPDNLLGEYKEFESVLLFNGKPIRFFKKGEDFYLRDTAVDTSREFEYTYITKLEGPAVSSYDHIAVAIAYSDAMTKNLLKINSTLSEERIESRAQRILKKQVSVVKATVETRAPIIAKKWAKRIQSCELVARIYGADPDTEIAEESELEKNAQPDNTIGFAVPAEAIAEKHFVNPEKEAIISTVSRPKGEKSAKGNNQGFEQHRG